MEKNKSSFLTTITIMIVAISIPITLLILQSGSLDFRIQAFDSEVPENVVVTDVKSDSFRVSWTTEKPTVGGVVLEGTTRAPLIEDEETQNHSLLITSLEPATAYQFQIQSSGELYLNTGNVNYTVQTAPAGNFVNGNLLVYGQVFSEDGLSFQQNGIIVIEIEKNGIRSQTMSAPLNEAGGYQINLDGILTADLSAKFDLSGDLGIIYTVHRVESDLPSVTKQYETDISTNRQLPNMYLGDVEFDIIPGIDGL
ncbi:fibronectin type III domain-containing protein [Candidatus Dojkabacteria bacterium]|uniref:Fibronectin type III domain-containing protein n=1 Tax=Candidatus Dojkabacteria bacterium TaxID=2099670 RepID=A0A955L584_9BACT|nr:fibronectin type III domain-containing protein [Candidatus Dojkabacteria bacterium]